jgi:tRNA (mo5U34)-methyltransferase
LSRIRRERWARFGPVDMGLSVPMMLDRRAADSRIARWFIRPLIRKSGEAEHEPKAIALPGLQDTLPAWRPSPSDHTRPDRDLLDRVADITWAQSIDLGRGVITPGKSDQRDRLSLYQLPASLVGMRCLDVRTRDGFWAFEMERRGAVEVIAIDNPKAGDGEGFQLAHDVLGSRVQRRIVDIEDLSPARFGQFDLVVMNDVLAWRRDPQLVLDQLRSVCSGVLYVTDVYHPGLELFGNACLAEYALRLEGERAYWYMGTKTIERMLRMADFVRVDELARFSYQAAGESRLRPTRLRVIFKAVVRDGPPQASSCEDRPAGR